ncbi:hypothetical protein ACQ3G6_00785 [Allorhizobium undicola]|uniref:hypothetical protein n=1 Tax=Allorhizobium undicola TaxID=78527 RepID=UPI003D345C91
MVFKISSAWEHATGGDVLPLADNDDHPPIGPFAAIEEWASDLANGVLTLGPRSIALHGLQVQECGLLSLTRCYEANDRAHIIALFEQAATTASSFCFSTSIVHPGYRSPVFCLGKSLGMTKSQVGSMKGIFIFPRFQTASPA